MSIREEIAGIPPTTWVVMLLLACPAAWADDGRAPHDSKGPFGEIVERQLPAASYIAERQVLLNLDNGELLAMPTNIWTDGFFNPRPRYTWNKKSGADLLVHSGQLSTNLSFNLDDGRIAIVGDKLTFESIAASDVERELGRLGVFQLLEVPKPQKGQGAVLVFKTREGGLGVMQLVEFSSKPEPVLKLRYKLVRSSPGPARRGTDEPGPRD